MSLAAPAAGVLGLTLVAITALYILRVRRPDQVVPSTLLWRRSVADRRASVPWQRLRASWLLLLQLLAAAILVLAVMRPLVAEGAHPGLRTIIVIDASATMQTADVAPSRFDAARAQARALLDGVGADDRTTLIAMTSRARIVSDVRGDPGALRAALDGLRPSNGGADLQGALALAAAAAGAGPSRLVLYSDGITEPLRAPIQLPFAVEYHSIGVTTEDVAITAINIENGPPSRVTAVHVQNQGRQRHDVAAEYRVDGHLADSKPLSLDAGEGRDLSFPLSDAAARVEVSLSPPDALGLDDVAVAVASTPRTYRVLLVTHRNLYLERALRLRSDLAVTIEDPAAYHPDPSYDLVVFDGFVPAQLPDRPTWYLAPPADPRLGTADEVSPGRLVPAEASDPLLTDVDLGNVHVARSRSLAGSGFGRALISSASGPLVMLRDSAPRAVLFGFDIHESDLPLRDAFPILVDRLTGFLVPEALPPRSHEPGDPVAITPANPTAAVTVTKPDGGQVSLPAGGGVLAGDDTDQTGLYEVSISSGGAVDRSAFAVNALEVGRTSVAPRPRPQLSGTASAPAQPATAPPRELWPLLAAGGLVILSLEWLVWRRGA